MFYQENIHINDYIHSTSYNNYTITVAFPVIPVVGNVIHLLHPIIIRNPQLWCWQLMWSQNRTFLGLALPVLLVNAWSDNLMLRSDSGHFRKLTEFCVAHRKQKPVETAGLTTETIYPLVN